MNGIQRINDTVAETSNNDQLFKKTMLALENFANKASAGSSTQDAVKIAIGAINEANKRKRDEEPEEEDPIMMSGMYEINDDNSTVIDMNIRKRFKNPNMEPNEWWTSENTDKVTKPIVGTNMLLHHLMPGRVNARTIRRVHDRSLLVTCKSLSSNNAAICGEKKMQYSLKPTEEDETILLGGRGYVECKTVFEIVDSVMNLVAIIHQVRPYSYEAIALLRALHHMRFYYGVTSEAKTQKSLCEKYVSEVLTYNQRRGAEKKHPATFKKCLELGKEVAITNGIAADLLVVRSDPYCGKRDPSATTGSKELDEMRKEVKELRMWKANFENKNYGQRPMRGRGRQNFLNSNDGSNRRRTGQWINKRDGQMNLNIGNNNGGYNGNNGGFQGNNGGFQGNSGYGMDGNSSQNQNQDAKMTKMKLDQTCVYYNGGIYFINSLIGIV